jgi:hypothetical protein
MRFPGCKTAKFDEGTGLPVGGEEKTIGEIANKRRKTSSFWT